MTLNAPDPTTIDLERLRALIASSDLVGIIDANDRLAYLGPGFEALTGYAIAERLGVGALEDIHPDDRAVAADALRELRESEPSRVIRVRYRRRHKTRGWIVIEGDGRNLTGDPHVGGVVVCARDVTEQCAVERALREAEFRYEVALRASRSGLWDLDVVRQTTYWAPALKALLGYAEDEIEASFARYRELLHPDDRDRIAAALKAHLETDAPYDVEQRMLTKSGEYRWFRSVAQAQRDASGAAIRVVGHTADIHERKMRELATHESELLYRALFENTSTAVTVRRFDGQGLIDCNEAALRLYGYASRSELLGCSPLTLSAERQPDGRPSCEAAPEHIARAMRDGTARFEWLARRANGETFLADLRITVIDLKGERVMQTLIEDITERKQTAEAIRRRAMREVLIGSTARAFLGEPSEDATEAAMALTGKSLGVKRVSVLYPDASFTELRVVRQWFSEGTLPFEEPLDGRPIPAAIFTPIDVAVPGQGPRTTEDEAALAAWLATVQREHAGRRAVIPIGCGGRVFGIGVIEAYEGRTVSDDDADVFRELGEIVAVGRVRRAAEEALAKAKSEAIAASLAKSAFLANMSHELRTPLNGVIGMVDLLAGTALDERQKRYTEVARASAGLLLSVINDILDFSKIEAGKLELEHAAFCLADVVEEVASILALGAEDKSLELTCFAAHELVIPFRGDAARVRQVLMNLVSNAIKFTREGEVSVRAFAASDTPARTRVRVEVKDTGIGIPSDALGRLFRPFSQVDASTTRVHGGSGLGLVISRELVERMGGAIGVTSQPGRGSTFWFELDLEKVEPTYEVAGELDPRLSGIKVLAVDDNPTNRALLATQLTAAGLVCDIARDGETALRMLTEALRHAPYDVALLDQHMPSMSGLELARRIRADARLERTAIVMLGSLGHAFDPEEHRTLRISAFGTKPIGRKQLLRVLQSALGDGRARPWSKPPPKDAAPRALTSPPAGRRILVVEDSTINAEVATEILRTAGYGYDVAVDGRKAIDAALARRYDLILMDCHLPDVDGYEATRRLRALEKEGRLPGRVPIVALTASATQEEIAECIACGMDGHVAKPIDARRLIETIATRVAPPPAPVAPPAPPRAPPPPRATQPIANLTRAVERLQGNRDLLKRIIAQFVDEAPRARAKLRDRVTANDRAGAAFVAHRLRGQAASFDAEALVSALGALEATLTREDWPAAATALTTVEGDLDALVAVLRDAA